MNLIIKDTNNEVLEIKDTILKLSNYDGEEMKHIITDFVLDKDNIPLLITYLKGLLQQLKNESNESY